MLFSFWNHDQRAAFSDVNCASCFLRHLEIASVVMKVALKSKTIALVFRKMCCSFCLASMCTECQSDLHRRTPEVPPAALPHYMMICYAPTELYELHATVMDIICASVCITSMLCFTLENQYRSNHSFDEHAHANQYRMAARDNATSFPLPWHDFLQ